MKPFPNRALQVWNDGRFAPHVAAFGGGGGSTNTIQKSDPWSGQMAYLSDIYNIANSNYYDVNKVPQYYPGATYAPLTGQQQGVASQLIDRGMSGGSQALQNAGNAVAGAMNHTYTDATNTPFLQGNNVLSNELSADYLNPWNSPSFQTVVNNTLASAIPAATKSFTNGNRSNSGLQTRAATMAATDAVGNLAQNQYQANQAIQNAAQQNAASNFLTQQGNQIKMAGLAPLIDQVQTSGLTTGLTAAGMGQQDYQNQIQDAMQRFNYGQMLPWNQLGLYENAISGAGSPGGTSTTSQPYFGNMAGNIMGGISAATALTTAASAAAQAAGYTGLIMGASPLISM